MKLGVANNRVVYDADLDDTTDRNFSYTDAVEVVAAEPQESTLSSRILEALSDESWTCPKTVRSSYAPEGYLR